MCVRRHRIWSAAEDFAQLDRDGDVQLVVAALVGRLVGAPPDEPGDSPEAVRLQLVELDLDHPLHPYRFPRQVLLGVPPAHPAGHAAFALRLRPPTPWV